MQLSRKLYRSLQTDLNLSFSSPVFQLYFPLGIAVATGPYVVAITALEKVKQAIYSFKEKKSQRSLRKESKLKFIHSPKVK